MRSPAVIALALVLAGCGATPQSGYQGVIECDEVTVASEVSGRVASELVAEGQRIDGDAPLLRLDAEALALAAAEAEAQVAQAAAELARAQAPARPEDIAAATAEATMNSCF